MCRRFPSLFLFLSVVIVCVSACGGGDDDDDDDVTVVTGGVFTAEVATVPPPRLREELSPGDTLRVEIDASNQFSTNFLDQSVQLLPQLGTLRGNTTFDGERLEIEIDNLSSANPFLTLRFPDEPASSGGLVLDLERAPTLGGFSGTAIAGTYRATVISSSADDVDDEDELDDFPDHSAFDVTIGERGGLVWPGVAGDLQLVREVGGRLVARASGPEVAGLVPGRNRQLEILLQEAQADRSIRAQVDLAEDLDGDEFHEEEVLELAVELVPIEIFEAMAGRFQLTIDPTRPAPTGFFTDFDQRTFVLDNRGFANFIVDGTTLNRSFPVGVIDGDAVGFIPVTSSPGLAENLVFGLGPDRRFAGSGRIQAFDTAGVEQGSVFVDITPDPVLFAPSGNG